MQCRVAHFLIFAALAPVAKHCLCSIDGARPGTIGRASDRCSRWRFRQRSSATICILPSGSERSPRPRRGGAPHRNALARGVRARAGTGPTRRPASEPMAIMALGCRIPRPTAWVPDLAESPIAPSNARSQHRRNRRADLARIGQWFDRSIDASDLETVFQTQWPLIAPEAEMDGSRRSRLLRRDPVRPGRHLRAV